MSTAGLRTGSVFAGVVDYAKHNAPDLRVLFNENVVKLAVLPRGGGMDNLSAAVQLLETDCDRFWRAPIKATLAFSVIQAY